MSEINTRWWRDRLYRVGKTQTDLAKHIGVDKTAITKILSGKRNIALSEVEPIARFLEVKPSELLKNSGYGGDWWITKQNQQDGNLTTEQSEKIMRQVVITIMATLEGSGLDHNADLVAELISDIYHASSDALHAKEDMSEAEAVMIVSNPIIKSRLRHWRDEDAAAVS